VSFAYTPGVPALNRVSMDILPGRKTALIGASGSGKSTVLALALGFIAPQAGRITVNGLPLQDIDRQAWWSSLSVMPQRPHLFSGTVADNIRLGDPCGDDAAIAALAGALGITSLLDHDRLGEDGRGLSGGQIQRVALARALIRRAPLLVMDEPTAFLDDASEAIIESALGLYARDRTVLTAAHRLRTVEDADMIYVLEAGVIVARGTHEGLVNGNAYYRACLSLAEGVAA